MPLRLSELNGQLTSVSRFQGTICSVTPFDYLLRKINGQDIPEIAAARKARKELLAKLQDLVTMLSWQDFEALVDMIFSQSGWRRLGVVGGPQKTVDLELLLPTTGERAFVQVKSKTDQGQLDEYADRFSHREENRMFYVYHSSSGPVMIDDPAITLIGPERLSELVMDAGLVEWLITRVG